ncbi:MAG TPA: hypothetical protein VLX68_08780 [Chitinivibrionales bacterium]|nr:hypothetical protein [Chitinivibrionales bacterium]
MRQIKTAFASMASGILIIAGTACAVQVVPVERTGRTIQLDGFLLEWNKADARPLAPGSAWQFDACNTREGLTGYFTLSNDIPCPAWRFRFLNHRLSPYAFMDLQSRSDSSETFYRLSSPAGTSKKGTTAEWLIPWDSIWHDTSGAYQVGLFAFDTCGDTMQPIIFTGHVYKQKPPAWGGVYLKGILLAALMVVLFMLQRSARRKLRVRKNRY